MKLNDNISFWFEGFITREDGGSTETVRQFGTLEEMKDMQRIASEEGLQLDLWVGYKNDDDITDYDVIDYFNSYLPQRIIFFGYDRDRITIEEELQQIYDILKQNGIKPKTTIP